MKIIPLSKGQEAIVCDCHYDLVKDFKWHYAAKGYAAHSTYIGPDPNKKGKYIRSCVYMHQAILGAKGIDHRDGNRLNNQCSNLRPATQSQNLYNKSKQSNNTSGYKGVNWHIQTKKWRASITVNGKQKHLGLYITSELAAQAYNEIALKHHGEFAKLNKLPL